MLPLAQTDAMGLNARLCGSFRSFQEPVGEFRRRPESEQFFRLAKTAKQAMFVLSSMQPDAARRRKGRSKPDRILRQAPNRAVTKGFSSRRSRKKPVPVGKVGIVAYSA